jgi:hypothetical protein
MIVGIAKVRLQQVVIDVLRRQLRPHLRNVERLELQHHHRAGRVLRERLVDLERDLGSRHQLPVEQVRIEQLACDATAGFGHATSLPAACVRKS